MIKVANVCKSFDGFKAVDDISFDIKKGEIVGFLGPNGAGKTTTMRLLTGYLSADQGKVLYDGKSIDKDFQQIISKIGYLPENNPLYADMRVDEFLLFEAKLRGDVKIDQIKEIVAKTGLTNKVSDKISTLSKGYKQRVGLAKALLGDVDYLILDEPTTGLDPIQKEEVIDLIKSISKDKTILFSSHILGEVSKIADKIIIINEGKLIAKGTEKSLLKRYKTAEIILKTNAPKVKLKKVLKKFDSIKEIIFGKTIKKYTEVKLVCTNADDLVEDIFDSIVVNKWKLISLQVKSGDLDLLFNKLILSEENK